jgi:predicted peptidase
MLRRILFSLLFVIGSFFAWSQQTSEKFIQETHYLLYLPEGYLQDTVTRWPLVLFLHGSGERGHDLEKVKTHGPPKLVAQGKKFPFILVSPQAPSAGIGWEPNTLYQMLQDIKARYRVDGDRVYLTGLSMGGFGSWNLAMKHPEEFAAVVPICGGGDTAEIWQLRNMPVWCFHGALDNVVPLASSQKMVEGLKRYNPSVRFTIYPDANHNSWTVTYDNDSLYQWLLAQKKFVYKRVAADPALLKKYAGKYASTDRDSVQILFERDSLKAKTDRFTIELKPEARDRFFIDERKPEDLQFIWNRKGIVEGFV